MKANDPEDRQLRITPRWEVACSTAPGRFVAAGVPGAAQADMARAQGWDDWHFADNYRRFAPLEDVDFVYRTAFRAPELRPGESLWLCSKGIDYQCEVSLNGRFLASHEGALSPVEVRLDPAISEGDNILEIKVLKAPKKEGAPEGREQASHCCKPPVSYGWDWHPRLIPTGICDDTAIVVRKAAWLGDVAFKYVLSPDFSRADLCVSSEVCGREDGVFLTFSLKDSSGREVLSRRSEAKEDITAVLSNPRLWWTRDHGDPYIYNYEVVLHGPDGEVLDVRNGTAGFRRVRLVMNEGSWDRPEGSPKSRSDAPAQLELNGRRIFLKGSNWVCPDVFPGLVDEGRLRSLLDLAVGAGFNVLRCWGGCMPEKDAFYDMCDAHGILVWQEFPLACNRYPDDESYLGVLAREARALVARLRNHPCLAIWCGGNELFNSWSGMDDQSLALRLLGSICLEMDPRTPFLPTSPLTGMAHGNYLFRDGDREVYQWMAASSFTAYVEFGVPSLAPLPVLKAIIPENELFPVRPTAAWTAHHAFGAWDGKPGTWLGEETLRHYFGPASSLEELIAQSSLLQGEGYKAIYEEARRQKPHCSMALCWMFNEPWPAAANNSIISWPDRPKAAYSDVSAACRPRLASAAFSRFSWRAGEEFSLALWLLDDTFGQPSESLEIKAFISPEGTSSDEVLVGTWQTPPTADNTNLRGPVVRVEIPSWPGASRLRVSLRVSGRPELDSTYILAYNP